MHQQPLLSLILCSRNDSYEGNSVWRLQTSLNYVANQLKTLNQCCTVEVIVSDWGSKRPLREVLALSPEAAQITKFLETPEEQVKIYQQDSNFTEVLANNAAIRRARGTFIGRIDQDTLVGSKFIQSFLQLLVDDRGIDVYNAMMFVGRRSMPRAFAKKEPNIETITRYIKKYGALMPREGQHQSPWYDAPVGIVLMTRDMWLKYQGYNEQLLYWGFMETELFLRINSADAIINLEEIVGCNFYHLSHTKRIAAGSSKRKNPRYYPITDRPNSDNWGLADENLIFNYAPARQPTVAVLATDNHMEHILDLITERMIEAVFGCFRLLRKPFFGNRIEHRSQ